MADAHFEEIYRKYWPVLKRAASRSLHDPYWVEEAVQDTFYTALQKWDKVKDYEKLEAWLMTVLKYKTKEIQRRRQKNMQMLLALDFDPPADSGEDGLRLPENWREIAQEVLTPEEWYVLRRHTLEDAPHKEIAQEKDISVWTSEKRLERAKKKLKKHFQEEA